MKEIIGTLVKTLVDKPEEVAISEKTEGDTVKLKIKVAADDIGKVLGKQGKNIMALRTIAKAIGAKELKKKVMLDLDEY